MGPDRAPWMTTATNRATTISLLPSQRGATAGGVEPRERAAHVSERLLHPGQRVIGVDLILQVDVALVPDALELPQDRGDGDDALTHDALTFRGRRIAQVLGVHVEQPRPRVRDRPHDV